jgi:hypothetical protein
VPDKRRCGAEAPARAKRAIALDVAAAGVTDSQAEDGPAADDVGSRAD